MRLNEIDTPALLIDVPVMEDNIDRMAAFCRGGQAALRPHIKTHKCPELARRQLAAGAIGLTCAKVGEAEAMVAAGIDADFLIANEVVGPIKTGRLMKLAGQARMTVAVDDAENVAELGAAARRAGVTLGVLVDVDTGMHRCGVSPEAAASLAGVAATTPGLRFRGLMGYEGHAVFLTDRTERERVARSAMTLLLEARDRVLAAGLPVEVVSAAGSGTYDITGRIPGITELEAGSYILMDTRYRSVGLPFGCALTVLATVISRPTSERAVLDVGFKGITPEFGLPEVKRPEGVTVARLSEEHTTLTLEPGVSLRPGDRVELIPSHGCTTINLYERFYAIRDGQVQATWEISGRGKSQ